MEVLPIFGSRVIHESQTLNSISVKYVRMLLLGLVYWWDGIDFFKLILICVSLGNSRVNVETHEKKLISFLLFYFRRGNPVFCPLDRTKVDDLRLVWFS